MILDLAGVVAVLLVSEPSVQTYTNGQVYADWVPEDGEPPLILVTQTANSPLHVGPSLWVNGTVQVDMVGAPDHTNELRAVADTVTDILDRMRGTTHPNGVLTQSAELRTAVFSLDPMYTPAHPRWVLVTDVVARLTSSQGRNAHGSTA